MAVPQRGFQTENGFMESVPLRGPTLAPNTASRSESFRNGQQGNLSDTTRKGFIDAMTQPSYGPLTAGNPWQSYRDEVPEQGPDIQAGDKW